jgi:hypothetical protein
MEEETQYHMINITSANITTALQPTDNDRNGFEGLMPKEELQACRRVMDAQAT